MSPYGVKWLKNKKEKKGNKRKKSIKRLIEKVERVKKWIDNLEWGNFDDDY